MRYRYEYLTESQFSPAIGRHSFKLRAVPCSNAFQRVTASRLDISPACQWLRSVDGQGNPVQWGSIEAEHDTFGVSSVGEVEQVAPYVLWGAPAPYYLAPTQLTACTDAMLAFARRVAASVGEVGQQQPLPYALAPQPSSPFALASQPSSPFALATSLMHAVHARLVYTPCVTSITTTAADVWADPRGVCQDYAHLLLALCRAVGLHARYVAGFISGDGQTHAWVEVSDGQRWLPFDPTHDVQPAWGYLKLAHGRDAADCSLIRGSFNRWTSEWMKVRVTVVGLDAPE